MWTDARIDFLVDVCVACMASAESSVSDCNLSQTISPASISTLWNSHISTCELLPILPFKKGIPLLKLNRMYYRGDGGYVFCFENCPQDANLSRSKPKMNIERTHTDTSTHAFTAHSRKYLKETHAHKHVWPRYFYVGRERQKCHCFRPRETSLPCICTVSRHLKCAWRCKFQAWRLALLQTWG